MNQDTDRRDLNTEIRMTDEFTRKGHFLARADGLIQFPIGDRVVSVGFSDTNHNVRRDDGKVDVAIFDLHGVFTTENDIFDALGRIVNRFDKSIALTKGEFEDVLSHLILRKMNRSRPGIDAL